MQIWFVFSIVLSLLVAIFAVMNSNVITINFFWTSFQFSLSLVIFISAAFGAIIASFIGLFSKLKSTMKIRELNNKIKILEKDTAELNSQLAAKQELNSVTTTE